MSTKIESYRRYEKLFVLAYAVVMSLVLILVRFPGVLLLDPLKVYALVGVGAAYNIVFYFLLPQRYIGKNKTLSGILFGVLFITVLLYLTGYDQSPFFFLYYLAILTAALYLGPRETLVFSIFIGACYLFMVRIAGRELIQWTPWGVVHLIHMMALGMMALFASVLAHFIKQREVRTRSKAQKLAALTSLTQTLTSTLDHSQIFQHVVDSITQLLAVPLCFLWTLSPDKKELIECAGHTLIPLPPEAGKLMVGQGLVGWVAQHRQMIVLEDVHADSRLQHHEVARKLGFASYLAIPLMFGDRLFGVLEVGTTTRRKFTREEVDVCLSFASQSAIALNNSSLFTEGNERSRRLSTLKRFRDVIQMAVEESEVTQAMIQALQREFDLNQIVFMKKNPSENRLEVRNLLHPMSSDFEFSVVSEPNNCLALRSNRRFLMTDEGEDFSCPQNCHGALPGSYLCLPLIVGGSVTGVVHMHSGQANFWQPETVAYAESFVDQTAPILTSLNLLQQAQQRAVVDSLTGLYNRRFLFEFLHQQIVQTKRYGQALSILMLDLDHFKTVNDTFGHEAGDLVLKLFAMRLKESLRESDIAARYGGEEFVLVLPNTNLQGAVDLADKIRVMTRQISLAQVLPDLPNISLSAGVGSYPIHGETMDQLMRAADRALYRAKQRGRNRVETAELNQFHPPDTGMVVEV